MDRMSEYFDELGDSIDLPGYDCEHSAGVLTLRLGAHGTYVINRQPPNRQIWLSSPLSGPKRYDYRPAERQWRYGREEASLEQLLNAELSQLLGVRVRLSLSPDGDAGASP